MVGSVSIADLQIGVGVDNIATDPETGARKEIKLEDYSAIPVWPMDEIARVFGHAIQSGKYERNNWRKGFAWSWSIAAVFRHIQRWRRGERKDKETKLHPLAHAVAHLLFLMEYDYRDLGTDDRYHGELDIG